MSAIELFPLFLRLGGKTVLVVGGGNVAERKVHELLAAGAKVRLVTLEATPSLTDLATRGELELHLRAFVESDVDGAWLVVAATNEPDVQRRICARADQDRTLSIAIDDPPNGTAFSGSVVRRGAYTIAISSSGATPALTRLLREVLEQVLPENDWVEAAHALRDKWRSEQTPMASRFGELVRAFKARTGPPST